VNDTIFFYFNPIKCIREILAVDDCTFTSFASQVRAHLFMQ
jgi:hypothetical protein